MLTLFAAASSAPGVAPLALDASVRELFVDDENVLSREGVARVMHHPMKKGAVIRPWSYGNMTGNCETRSSPQWHEAKSRWELLVANCGIDEGFIPGIAPLDYTYPRWMYSDDLLQWVRGPMARIPASYEPAWQAVIDPTDTAERRYKVITPYNAGDPDAPPANNTLAGMYTSADGATWVKVPGQVIKTEDEQNLSFDRKSGQYIYTVKRTAVQHHHNKTWHSRAVAIATTTDFGGKWEDLGTVFAADAEDQRVGRLDIEARIADPTLMQTWVKPDPSWWNTDVYNMGVFRYESVYIGMPAFFHWVAEAPGSGGNSDGFDLIKLATSRDLRNWTRLGDRQTFIEPSHLGSGAYDLLQMLPPSDVLVRGDELWMYYTCIKDRYQAGEPAAWARGNPDRSAICMATLRRDGFISLEGGEKGGTVTTALLRAPAATGSATARPHSLYANVNASAGELTVEVLGSSLSAVARGAARRVDSTRLRIELRAPGPAAPFELGAAPFRLRFGLGAGVHLYSYWVE